MALSLLADRLGLDQGRIKPTAAPPVEGLYAFVLGSDVGRFADLAPGDYVRVYAAVDVTGIDVMGIDATLVCRAVPTGLKWRVTISVGIDDVATFDGWPNQTRRPEVRVNVSQLTGTQSLIVTLQIIEET